MQKFSAKRFFTLILLVLLCAAALYFSGATPLILLPMALLSYLYARGEQYAALGALVIYALAVSLLDFAPAGALALIAVAPPVVVAGEMIGRRKGVVDSLLFICGGVLVGLMAAILLTPVLTGKDIFTTVADVVRQMVLANVEGSGELLIAQVNEMLSAAGQPLDAATFEGQVEQFILLFQNSLGLMAPTALIGASSLGGLLLYALPSWALRRAGAKARPSLLKRALGWGAAPIPKLPPLRYWRMPRWLGFSLLGLTALTFVGSCLGGAIFSIGQMVSSALMSICFGAQGLALLSYYFNYSGKVPKAVRFIIMVLALIFASPLVMMLGMADLLFRIREIMELRRKSGGSGQGPLNSL